MHHFAIASDINWTINLVLLAFVWLKGQKKPITTAFCLYMFNIAAWSFCLARMVKAQNPEDGLFWARALHWGAITIPISFFHFTLIFRGTEYKRFERSLLRVGYGLAFVFLTFSFSTYFLPFTKPAAGIPYYPQPGPLYYPYAVFFLLYVVVAFWILIGAYNRSTGLKRTQLQYAILAYVIAYGGGTQAFLPVFGLSVSQYCLYGVPICMCMLTYTIFAHQFMDVKVIIRKTLLYSMLTGVLTTVYILIATQLTKFVEEAGGQAGFWSSAIAAVAVTLLFNPMLHRLRAFMDERLFSDWLGDMSRGVVHEVKGPLSSISLPAELTLMDLKDIEKGKQEFQLLLPVFKERMRGIMQKTSEAAERIEALYELAGSRGLPGRVLHMASVIENGIAAARHHLKKGSMPITLDLPKRLSAVRGSSKQLEIVVSNLIKNAAEAMDGHTSAPIHVSMTEDRKWVLLSVKDSGPGIREEERERLFDPNFTTKGSKGMGLGLYLSDKIVREHGGTIEVRSEPGKGTEFIVRLPKQSQKQPDAA